MTPLDHALDYAARGLAVFPCNPSPRSGVSKRPLIEHGFKAASREEEQIRAWWSQWPDALIGLPMGHRNGLWAIDPDVAKEPGDADGLTAWLNISRLHPPIRTHTHLTPSGGKHLVFRWRDDRPVTNSERGLKARGIHGINVRGEGGYIIAAGSRLTDGRTYDMEEPFDFFHFAEADAWLYELLEEPAPEARQGPNVVDFRGQRQAPPDRYVQTAIAGECWALAQSGRGERNNRLNAAAFSLGQLVGAGLVDEDTVRGSLLQAAGNCGLIADDGERPVLATIESGLAAGRLKPRDVPDRQEHRHEMRGTGTDGPAPAPQSMRRDRHQMAEPLEVVCAADLAGKPIPPRQEHVEGMIPAGNVTLLYGDGGTGKSLLALQLAVATAAGSQWIGLPVARGSTLFLTAEDEVDEVHRRLASICALEGLELAEMSDLDITSLAGKDAVLSVADSRAGTMKETPLFAELERWIEGHGNYTLIVLDTLADLFGGEENARAHARQFIGQLRGLAIRRRATIVLLAHPSLSGMASGTGTSGNTAWSNSVRSRLYLERVTMRDGDRVTEPDPDVRVLATKKVNYGRVGGEVRVRWTDGVFVPCGQPGIGNSAALEAIRAERVFLDLLGSYTAQGRYVSSSPSSTFAPSVFCRDAKAEGVTKAGFLTAMNNLFAEGRIVNEVFGPPSKPRHRIALKRDNGDASD